MERVQKFTQAYDQTPWRRQLQGIGLFLAVLVTIALIAGVYLNVTARATTVGRQIQNYHADIDYLQRDIKDKQAQLGFLTSAVEMERRAGVRPAPGGAPRRPPHPDSAGGMHRAAGRLMGQSAWRFFHGSGRARHPGRCPDGASHAGA